jgi:hypothetical protein
MHGMIQAGGCRSYQDHPLACGTIPRHGGNGLHPVGSSKQVPDRPVAAKAQLPDRPVAAKAQLPDRPVAARTQLPDRPVAALEKGI